MHYAVEPRHTVGRWQGSTLSPCANKKWVRGSSGAQADPESAVIDLATRATTLQLRSVCPAYAYGLSPWIQQHQHAPVSVLCQDAYLFSTLNHDIYLPSPLYPSNDLVQAHAVCTTSTHMSIVSIASAVKYWMSWSSSRLCATFKSPVHSAVGGPSQCSGRPHRSHPRPGTLFHHQNLCSPGPGT